MKTWIIPLLAGTLAVAGCSTQEYRTQPLGSVTYAQAFDAGKAVMGNYFSIASADSETGKIISRPKMTNRPSDRLLGGTTPARQMATLRIHPEGDQMVADIRIVDQRQDSGQIMRQMQPLTVDNERPTQGVFQDGALTQEQGQAWETTGREVAMERNMLADLLTRLQAKPAATQPEQK
jgi:hypothetical protein